MCQGGPELRRSHGRLRTVSAEAGVGWGLLLPRGSPLPELVSGNSLRMCLRSYKRGGQRCRDKLDPGPGVHLSVPPPAQPLLAERRLQKAGSTGIGNLMFCGPAFGQTSDNYF